MAGEFLRAYLPDVMPPPSALGNALSDVANRRMQQRQIDQDRREMEERKATAEALRESTWQNERYKPEWHTEEQARDIREKQRHDQQAIDAEKAKTLAANQLAFQKEVETPELATNSNRLLAMRARGAALGLPIETLGEGVVSKGIENAPAPGPTAVDEVLGKPKGIDPMELLSGPQPGRQIPSKPTKPAKPATYLHEEGAEPVDDIDQMGAQMAARGDEARKRMDAAPGPTVNAAGAQYDTGLAAAERKMKEREAAAGPPVMVGGTIVDPILNAIMMRNRQKAAHADSAPGPNAHKLERKAFEEGRKTAIELAPILGDEKAAAAGEKVRNEIANRENARINAAMSGSNFHAGEGRRVASQLQGQINSIVRETQAQFKTPALHTAVAASDTGLALLNTKNPLAHIVTLRQLIKSIHGAQAAVVEGEELKNAGAFTTRVENALESLESGQMGATAKKNLLDVLRDTKRLSLTRLDMAGKAGKARAANKGMPIDVSPWADSVYQSIISSPTPAAAGPGADASGSSGGSIGGGEFHKGEGKKTLDEEADKIEAELGGGE